MKALAHPTRLLTIDELSRGERCVCELQREIGSDISTVSKHLSLLRSSGIVGDEKRGTRFLYSLEAKRVPRLLQCIENVVKDNACRQLKVAQ